MSVERRGVRGTAKAIAARLAASGGGQGSNTADLERLNATVRASLAPLVRRGRAIAHTEAFLTAGRWLVGWAYHFCWLQQSLRLAAPAGAPWQWQACTPAMAAGLTDHRWTMRELMRFQLPLPPWVAPKHQGRCYLRPIVTRKTFSLSIFIERNFPIAGYRNNRIFSVQFIFRLRPKTPSDHLNRIT